MAIYSFSRTCYNIPDMKNTPKDGGTEIWNMKYKHIVFDVDGTLLDTAECILYSLRQALLTVTGSSPEVEELTHVLSRTSAANMEHLGITDKAEETIALWVANEEKYSDMMQPFAGIPKLLDTLKNAGCQLGIVTSRTHEELDLVLNPLPISTYFSVCICSDDTEEHKPSPAPLLKYMEETGAKSGEVLYIGDSLGDSMCASAAGAHFAYALWGAHENAHVPAEYYPEDPARLSELISD